MKISFVISTQPTRFQAVTFSPDFEANAARLADLCYDGIELAVRDPATLDVAGIKAGDQPTSIPNLNAGGDLIVAIDGQPVRRFDELLAYLITNKAPGDSVVLTVMRGDQKVDVTVKLDKRP